MTVLQPVWIRAAAGIASGLLLACTPQLNWRNVELGRLTTLLPCKPDSARREVTLAGQTVPMDMVGCSAADALFAISRIQAADAAQASQLLAALRQAALASVRAHAQRPMPVGTPAEDALDLQVEGQRADGGSMQARFKWMQQGSEIYQLAVYADRMGAEYTESLMAEARLR